MGRQGKAQWILAIGLSVLAGFVDAIGFIHLGGFFVSFMSGNATRLGVGIARNAHEALVAGGLAFAFVLGVALGSVVGEAGRHRRPVWVLLLVAALLIAAAIAGRAGHAAVAAAAMTLAMGAENAALTAKDGGPFGVTYVTGALVKAGHGLAKWARGGSLAGERASLLLWSGLAIGAAIGALCYAELGLLSLWITAGVAVALAALAEGSARSALR